MNKNHYDKIIIGAGLYGLYAALFSARKGERILVLEYDPEPFSRATYVNQARVHMGYHYPRSLTTAVKSAEYFNRFVEDFSFCIHQEFAQVYAISSQFSWTNGTQFMDFCRAAGISCEEVPVSRYFKPGMCEGAYLTKEYTYDAGLLGRYFMEQLKSYANVDFIFQARITRISKSNGNDRQYASDLGSIDHQQHASGLGNVDNDKANSAYWEVILADGQSPAADFILNASYASVNQILNLLTEPENIISNSKADKIDTMNRETKETEAKNSKAKNRETKNAPGKDVESGNKYTDQPILGAFPIKYELCEIILCKPSPSLQDIGITVMDGPFFSIMPFGKTGIHSLTSVTFTPHITSYETLPVFSCQSKQKNATNHSLNTLSAELMSANSGVNSIPNHDLNRMLTKSLSPSSPQTAFTPPPADNYDTINAKVPTGKEDIAPMPPQAENLCTPAHLGNCNTCPARPDSTWPYMSHLADKYLKEEYTYQYEKSLFSMKPILKSSEVDDSRPTAIKVISTNPPFISVLSGKINTVYDLDAYLS